MTEYILNVDDEGAARQIIDKFGIEETRVFGYSFTGEEIVRCRDCRLSMRHGGLCKQGLMTPDGYCAWGERKDDGDER